MNPIDTKLMLPFMGTASNGEVFQYLLLKITQRSALIGIPNWLVNHTHYAESDILNLHLNRFTINLNTNDADIKGLSESIPSSDASFGSLYRVEFETPLKGHRLFRKNTFEDLTPEKRKERILWTIYDTFLLKKGVNVYMKHLIPFLSRILQVTEQEYGQLKQSILLEMQHKIQVKCEALELIYELTKGDDSPFCELDLERLREIVQSEIDVVLMQLAFEGPEKLKDVTNYTLLSYDAYLHSIKTLEHRLYANFNCLTALYISQGSLVRTIC